MLSGSRSGEDRMPFGMFWAPAVAPGETMHLQEDML